jgi:hypothetical protein
VRRTMGSFYKGSFVKETVGVFYFGTKKDLERLKRK